MRSAMSRTSFNLWVMKMTDIPSRVSIQDREELRRFLGGEDSGGLVEDEDVGLSVERLQDLDALLLADRDVLDVCVRDRWRSRTIRQLSDARVWRPRSRGRRPLVGSVASTMFSATVITGMSMKCWCTIPIPRADRVTVGSGT